MGRPPRRQIWRQICRHPGAAARTVRRAESSHRLARRPASYQPGRRRRRVAAGPGPARHPAGPGQL